MTTTPLAVDLRHTRSEVTSRLAADLRHIRSKVTSRLAADLRHTHSEVTLHLAADLRIEDLILNRGSNSTHDFIRVLNASATRHKRVGVSKRYRCVADAFMTRLQPHCRPDA